jgi:hypothetical protein
MQPSYQKKISSTKCLAYDDVSPSLTCCKNLVCRSLEMQGVTPQLDPRMSEDQISQKRLKALVQSLEWTYGVVWKLSSSDGLLEWVHGWFNPLSTESAQTLMSQFYSIFKGPCALGFSALALQRGSPIWWTSNMAEIRTDKYKAQFLQEAHIQTVVCIPGLRADGMYCTELATTDLVPETDALMNSLQDYVSTSVKPHMLGVIESPLPSSLSPLNPGGQGDLSSDQFSSLGVTCPPNSGTPSAQIMEPGSSGDGFIPSLNVNRYAPHGDFNECRGNSGTILREEEPYFLWTAPGNQSLFFDYEFPSALFNEIHIDVDVEKTMFNSLESKVTKSSSNPDMMTSCKWDSDTLNSKEVDLEAMTMPEFTASSVEHSSCKKCGSLPATNAQDLLNLLAGNKPCDPSAAKSTSTVSRETDKQFSSFSHLLEASCSYSTPEAPLKTSDQATSSINAFYLQQSTDMSFIKDLAGQPNNVTNLLMDVHSCKPALPASNFRHVHESLFKRTICSKLPVHGGNGHSSQQSLLRQWTEKIVPMIKEAQKLADQELTRSCGTLSSGECGRMPNPAHDEAAHVHKLAERSRRNNFNEKLHTLCTLIPIIKKVFLFLHVSASKRYSFCPLPRLCACDRSTLGLPFLSVPVSLFCRRTGCLYSHML